MKKQLSLTPLEEAVIEGFISHETSKPKLLTPSCEKMKVEERELTGAGFFTYFVSPESFGGKIKPIESTVDLAALINNECNVGFKLYSVEGYITCLEGYTMGCLWPEVIKSFELVKW